jgi:hypothetical protein
MFMFLMFIIQVLLEQVILFFNEQAESSNSSSGSLILEFATLSRLTGDDRFEKAAYKAFFALWNRKSEIGLVGNTINVRTGVRRSYYIFDLIKLFIGMDIT